MTRDGGASNTGVFNVTAAAPIQGYRVLARKGLRYVFGALLAVLAAAELADRLGGSLPGVDVQARLAVSEAQVIRATPVLAPVAPPATASRTASPQAA